MRLLISASAILGMSAIGDARARACSAWPEGVDGRNVLPAAGATGVPTNARVLVEYDDWSGNTPGVLELRSTDGQVIATTVADTWAKGRHTIVLTPGVALDPATTYEIWDTFVVPCPTYEPCIGASAVIATFTTGDAEDTTPPGLSGATVSTTHQDVGFESTCDWQGDGVTHQVSPGGLSDDRPVGELRYLYYDDAGALLAGPLPLVPVGHACTASPYWPLWDLGVPTDTFAIRAVDLAGNIETEAHVLTGQSCEELAPVPDAGPGGGDGADAGCCAAGDRGNGSMLLALLLGTNFALDRRRRRP